MQTHNQEIVNLPTGKWQIFGNMEEGVIDITSVDLSTGDLKGTAFGDPISGIYHAASGQIHFSRKMGIDQFQIYSGHISVIRRTIDASPYLLAGSYVTFTSGFRSRPQFGWYATITKVIP